MTSQEKLHSRFEQGYHICVGLDTDLNKIPTHLKKNDNPVFDFNREIINKTASHAAAFKINFAFYERDGIEGLKNLIKAVELIPEEILIIADAKRGDIGNTSKMYAQSIFEHYGFDSVTLHPYMGKDSIEPFLHYREKLNFILALTSNPSNIDFEKKKLENGNYLFQEVIEQVNSWNSDDNCGLVFGATNIDELDENIDSFNNMPILLPGVGAQGGSLTEVVKLFKKKEKDSFLINISRGLIYADSSEDFANIAKNKIIEYNNKIKSLLDY